MKTKTKVFCQTVTLNQTTTQNHYLVTQMGDKERVAEFFA